MVLVGVDVHKRTHTFVPLDQVGEQLGVPAHAPKPRSLDRTVHQQALRAWLLTLEGVVAELALEELDEVIAWTARINELQAQLRKLARTVSPSGRVRSVSRPPPHTLGTPDQ